MVSQLSITITALLYYAPQRLQGDGCWKQLFLLLTNNLAGGGIPVKRQAVRKEK